MVLRLDAEDYLDMPELVNNTIRVELPTAARKIYDDMEDEFLAELAAGAITVTATNAGAALNKCSQIANGGLYHERPDVPDSTFGELRTRTAAVVHDAKTEALLDLIEELNGAPLLIAYEFQHDAARIQAAIKKRFRRDVLNIGGTSMVRAKEIERQWNAGELTELLGHPASMGHGLNLQKSGNHICWYGVTWDYELYDQTVRRIRRQGCKHAAVFVHHIIATKTVDEPKMRALAGKKSTQDGFLNALKDYAALKTGKPLKTKQVKKSK
jgi:SNF2 family DNA or RNA helicase